MHPISVEELVRSLQSSVSPVVMISGVGLLVLSMTNRLGRSIDRARQLANELDRVEAGQQPALQRQLAVLYRRSQILRLAITFAVACIFFVSLLILLLFALSTVSPGLTHLGAACFVAAVLCLVVSMGLFLQDLALALQALREELGRHLGWMP